MKPVKVLFYLLAVIACALVLIMAYLDATLPPNPNSPWEPDYGHTRLHSKQGDLR